MHHPVADRDQPGSSVVGQLAEHHLQRRIVVGDLCCSSSSRAGTFADPLDDPVGHHRTRIRVDDSIFHRRRPGVQHEHRCDHVGLLRLDRRDRHGVDDVLDQRTPGQVVDRLLQPLQHRADRDRACAALHRLVGVVAGVEVGEDQHRGPAGDLRVRHLGLGHRGLDRGVVLDGPVDEQVRLSLAHQFRCRPDLVDVRAGAATCRSSTTAWPPAGRCRTARRCAPTRSRCRPVAPTSGSGTIAQSP